MSQSAHHALSVIAHASMARELDKKVFEANGASGFYDFWLKDQKPGDRAILTEFFKIQRQAYADMARMIQKDLSPEPGPGA